MNLIIKELLDLKYGMRCSYKESRIFWFEDTDLSIYNLSIVELVEVEQLIH